MISAWVAPLAPGLLTEDLGRQFDLIEERLRTEAAP